MPIILLMIAGLGVAALVMAKKPSSGVGTSKTFTVHVDPGIPSAYASAVGKAISVEGNVDYLGAFAHAIQPKYPIAAKSLTDRAAQIQAPHRTSGDRTGDALADLEGTNEFQSAWKDVENQVRAEGGDVTAKLGIAKGTMEQALNDMMAKGLNALGMQPSDMIQAAKQYSLAVNTIGGAVQNVQGMIGAAQRQDNPQLANMFWAALVTVGVATGVVSMGVGAAITMAVALTVQILQGAGLLGGPQPFSLPGCKASSSRQPDYAIGCLGVFAPANDGAKGLVASNASPRWRKFPKLQDPFWFNSRGGTWGAPGDPEPPVFVGASGNDNFTLTTPIYVAWPMYQHLQCELGLALDSNGNEVVTKSLPGAAGDFQKAFWGAWKMNQERALNGLQAVDDAKVLLHVANVWNAAHDPGAGADFYPSYGDWLHPPAGYCNVTAPYFTYLIEELIRNGQLNAGKLHINTGGLKPVPPPPPPRSVATAALFGNEGAAPYIDPCTGQQTLARMGLNAEASRLDARCKAFQQLTSQPITFWLARYK